MIWTAGVKASHLGQKLTEATGCEVDRGGRVIVNPEFSITNNPEISIAGDLCSYSHTVNGTQLPGMASKFLDAWACCFGPSFTWP